MNSCPSVPLPYKGRNKLNRSELAKKSCRVKGIALKERCPFNGSAGQSLSFVRPAAALLFISSSNLFFPSSSGGSEDETMIGVKTSQTTEILFWIQKRLHLLMAHAPCVDISPSRPKQTLWQFRHFATQIGHFVKLASETLAPICRAKILAGTWPR
uniref:Uncharacterized protein n=1 Tax=Globodera rostochiensis TaxID=31243 RepID=A0A914I9H4_GLORO